MNSVNESNLPQQYNCSGTGAFFPPTTLFATVYFVGKLFIALIPEGADLSPSGIMKSENDPVTDGHFPRASFDKY